MIDTSAADCGGSKPQFDTVISLNVDGPSSFSHHPYS